MQMRKKRAPVLRTLCIWRYTLTRCFAFFLISTLLITPTFAEEYKPVFQSALPAQLDNTLVSEYKSASQSKNINMAITAWENFLTQYSYTEPAEIGDLTDLIFIRQAHFELARLYYLNGNVVGGDKLINEISNFNVYSSPEISNGKKWCTLEGYCR